MPDTNFNTSTAKITRVVHEYDRTLLYPEQQPSRMGEYHIIAPLDCKVKEGDTVRYEPYGVNFGWLVEGGERDE